MTDGSTPTAHYQTEHVTLYHGDCRDILAQLPDNSVDSIVTDPPYGIEFMGKQWDAFAPEVAPSTAARTGSKTKRNDGDIHAHSVLSGAPLPVFGGNRSRTFVCTLCGKRDQFRNPHKCDGEPAARWESIVINEHGAPAAAIGFQQWCEQWARECLRVLKPGGHLLAFGGARTYHRLACAIEDAGFDIRDSIHWIYGSGFPKSMDVGKQLDKQAGAVRERQAKQKREKPSVGIHATGFGANGWAPQINIPITDDAITWHGWGTALKPAHEPIVVARKPPRDTIANNVLRYGTGALNIDATRIPATDGYEAQWDRPVRTNIGAKGGAYISTGESHTIDISANKPSGRWPANIIHDGSDDVLAHFGDDGSAARFFNCTPHTDDDAASFIYCAKAGTRERNAGLDHLDKHPNPGVLKMSVEYGPSLLKDKPTAPRTNHHPTVKPLALMRHLIRLVTPPDGIILEPFAGSGTTLAAATLEGFNAIGIELTADYLPIIIGRIEWAAEQHANQPATLF